jgi:hypothetical protein
MDPRFSVSPVLAAFALLALVACGRSETTPSQRGGNNQNGSNLLSELHAGRGVTSMQAPSVLSTCRSAASFNDKGAGWAVARALLQCTDGSATVSCLSDNLTCPRPNLVPDAKESSCVDRCPTDGYAAAASGSLLASGNGGASTPLPPGLPAACTSAGAVVAGGVQYFCCPCE